MTYTDFFLLSGLYSHDHMVPLLYQCCNNAFFLLTQNRKYVQYPWNASKFTAPGHVLTKFKCEWLTGLARKVWFHEQHSMYATMQLVFYSHGGRMKVVTLLFWFHIRSCATDNINYPLTAPAEYIRFMYSVHSRPLPTATRAKKNIVYQLCHLWRANLNAQNS